MSVTNVKFTEAPTPAEHSAKTAKFKDEISKLEKLLFQQQVAELYHLAIYSIKATNPSNMTNKERTNVFNVTNDQLLLKMNRFSEVVQKAVQKKLQDKGWYVDLYTEEVGKIPVMQIAYP